jgi:sugar phosphate permease
MASGPGAREVRGSRIHYGWIIVGTLFVVAVAAAGGRGVFTVFIKPIEGELGWARTTMSAAAAIGLLVYGGAQPFIGTLADRLGPRALMAGGTLLAGLGVVGLGVIRQPWHLLVLYGLVIALGSGAAANVTAAVAASRWFTARRALAVSIASAGFSVGQVVFYPAAMALTLSLGWRVAAAAVGAVLAGLVAPVAAWLLRDDPADKGLLPYGAAAGGPGGPAPVDARQTSLREALRAPSFWLLAGSFFICGYTTFGLIGVHFLPYAVERRFPPMTAANAMALMGGLNVVGTVGSGYLCDRLGKSRPLATFYFFRGLSLLSLLWVRDAPSLYAFAVVYGLNWISTVPPTATLTADLFGHRSVGTLFGVITFSHQLGGALASYLGGVLFDALGSYDLAFISAGILAVGAAGMALAIDEAPAPAKPVMSPAPGD